MTFLIGSMFFFVLGAYGAIAYRAWQIRSGFASATQHESEKTAEMWKRLLELAQKGGRRLADQTGMMLGRSYLAIGGAVRTLLFKFFPRLRAVLEPKDKLLGLYRGPASLFLANVSKYKQELRAVRGDTPPLPR